MTRYYLLSTHVHLAYTLWKGTQEISENTECPIEYRTPSYPDSLSESDSCCPQSLISGLLQQCRAKIESRGRGDWQKHSPTVHAAWDHSRQPVRSKQSKSCVYTTIYVILEMLIHKTLHS